MKKCLTFFYGLRKNTKALRKLFIHGIIKQPPSTQHKQNTKLPRAPYDVLCYRCSLTENVTQARRFIRKKQVFLFTAKHKVNPFKTSV